MENNLVELPEGCVIVKQEQLDALREKVRAQDIALTNAFTLVKMVEPIFISFVPKTGDKKPEEIDFFKLIGEVKKLVESDTKSLMMECINTLLKFKEGFEKQHPIIHKTAEPNENSSV